VHTQLRTAHALRLCPENTLIRTRGIFRFDVAKERQQLFKRLKK
jgi:hypothetical protein